MGARHPSGRAPPHPDPAPPAGKVLGWVQAQPLVTHVLGFGLQLSEQERALLQDPLSQGHNLDVPRSQAEKPPPGNTSKL